MDMEDADAAVHLVLLPSSTEVLETANDLSILMITSNDLGLNQSLSFEVIKVDTR